MSGEAMANCCCEGGGGISTTYWAEPCDPQPGYCCPQACNPYAVIAYCPYYLLLMGIPVPPVPGRCYIIREGCCYYRLSYSTLEDCATAVAPIKNVGYLVEVYDPTKDRNCCDEYPDDPAKPQTCLMSLMFQLGVAGCTGDYGYTPTPCTQIVAENYQFYDQMGTVKGKAPRVRSTHQPCYETFGVAPNVYANNCPPITHANAPLIQADQAVGMCNPTDPISSCAGQRTYLNMEFLTCSECNPCGELCPYCPPSGDPCDGIPPLDPFCPDPAKCYSVRTCYSVNDCLDEEAEQIYQEEHVLNAIFYLCEPVINTPSAIAAAKAAAIAQISIVPYSRASDIGYISAILLSVCGITVDVVSGNANHIEAAAASAKGSAINTAVDVKAVQNDWATYMWFGTRQTCTCCCSSNACGCTNTGSPPTCIEPNGSRPPSWEGDELFVKDASMPDLQTVVVRLFGRSKKKYICACQSVTMIYPGVAAGGSTICAISRDFSTPYGLGCISIAAYSKGDRYQLQRVEELPTFTTICTSKDAALTVPLCNYRDGFPYEDKYVGGVLQTLGFEHICLQMDNPCSNSCSYPYVYTPVPCCDSSDCVYCYGTYYPNTPTYVLCPGSAFDPLIAYQAPGYSCCCITSNVEIVDQ